MTSIPVFNKLMALITGNETSIQPLAMGEDSEFAYNRIQIFVAVVLGLLTAFGQYLKYKTTSRRYLFQKLMWPTVAALVLGSLILAFGNIDYRDHGIGYLVAIWLAVVTSVYAIVQMALTSGWAERIAETVGRLHIASWLWHDAAGHPDFLCKKRNAFVQHNRHIYPAWRRKQGETRRKPHARERAPHRHGIVLDNIRQGLDTPEKAAMVLQPEV
jgi:hypothetical protein